MKQLGLFDSLERRYKHLLFYRDELISRIIKEGFLIKESEFLNQDPLYIYKALRINLEYLLHWEEDVLEYSDWKTILQQKLKRTVGHKPINFNISGHISILVEEKKPWPFYPTHSGTGKSTSMYNFPFYL